MSRNRRNHGLTSILIYFSTSFVAFHYIVVIKQYNYLFSENFHYNYIVQCVLTTDIYHVPSILLAHEICCTLHVTLSDTVSALCVTGAVVVVDCVSG